MKTNREIRVLIAEDDVLVAGIIRDELASIGLIVVGIAANGKLAVDMTLELKPDVVLMDITMPKMDGIEAAAAIQVSCPTPVVILTAHDEAELVARATLAGVGAFLLKPPQAQELERAIAIAIARHADLLDLRRVNGALEKANDALRRSEERYRSILNASPDDITITDRDGRIIMVSPVARTMFRQAGDEEFVGRLLTDFLIPEDRDRARVQVARKHQGVITGPSEYRGLRCDGTTFDIEVNSELIREADGSPAGMVVIVRDITERKAAEKAVHESAAHYEALVHSINDAIISADSAGNIVSLNPAAERIFGYTEVEVRGRPITLLQPAQYHDRHRAGLARVQSGGAPHVIGQTVEVQGRRKDGSEFPLLLSLSEWQVAEGKNFTAVIRDITERKQAEGILQARVRLSEYALNNSLDELLTRVLDEAELLTGSTIGFFHFVEADQKTLSLQTWSTNTLRHMCTAEGKGQHYSADVAGVWVDALRERGPVVYNDYASLPHRHGLPPGHATVLRELVVPVLRNEQVVALLGVGNKPREYGPEDMGSISQLANLAWDIVSAKHAETELRASEERHRAIAHTAMDGFWRVDLQGRLLEVNGTYCRMSGYTEQELLAMSVPELVVVETTTDTAAHIRKVMTQGADRFESWQRRKDGSTFLVEVSALYYAPDGGSLLVFVRDITARKQAEERLRRQATLLDSATDAIYVRLLDHTVTYWNLGAERLYGWLPAEAIGRKLTELGLVEPAGFATAQAALLAHGDWSGEVNKTGKDGKEHVVFCRWTLLRDEQGHPREVLAINTDITDKKQLESQYLRAQRMEGIGMLAGGIAHDLNNILTPIMMSASLLRDAVRDAEGRQLLDSVQFSAQRGADIVRQLLTFARGQPGVRALVPVRQLLREMEKLIRETFPRNLHLAVTVPPELWPVVGDTTQIYQALMNLCVNARDAIPDGGTLTLAADNVTLDDASAALMLDAKPGPHVRLCVTDTGTGIAAEHLERIFDPFFTTKEVGKGTGLGLPTALGIVRGHGGSVRVDSRVGQGTTFELYLPASPEATPADPAEREVRMPRGHGELILVVDDEATVRGTTQRVLEKYGYRVLAAAEGEAALVLFARHRTEIKAVLTDMMMPGMDGPKLVRALRQLDARLPILGMTGLIEQGTFKGLEGLDAVPLLAKPFEVEKLLVALRQTLTARNPTTGSTNDVGARDGLRDASR